MNLPEYLDIKWNELTQEQKSRGKSIIERYVFPTMFIEDIETWRTELVDSDKWIGLFHHFGGMQVRNILRQNGFKDDETPDKNLDDYYIQLLQYALGIRK